MLRCVIHERPRLGPARLERSSYTVRQCFVCSVEEKCMTQNIDKQLDIGLCIKCNSSAAVELVKRKVSVSGLLSVFIVLVVMQLILH